MKDGRVPRFYSPDAFYFTLAAGAEEEKSNIVLIRFDLFTQAHPQSLVLSRVQITLKHRKLHPLSIRLENIVNFRASFVLGNIVSNHNIHNPSTKCSTNSPQPRLRNRQLPLITREGAAISTPKADIGRFLPSNTSPSVVLEFQRIPDRYIFFPSPDG